MNRGWSVIPLYGSSAPERAKLPALPKWDTFQKRHATDAELDLWFNQQARQGIGIICGRISALAVLDLDDAFAAEAFAAEHPHLTQTLTICSGQRKLPHYYFHIPTDITAKTQRTPYAEFRFDGCYVVAAPTSDGKHQWQISRNTEAKTLTVQELHQISAFLTTRNKIKNTKRAAADSKQETQDNNLLQRFHQQAPRGRNNALFYTSIYARNCGWNQQSVETLLLPTFIDTPKKHSSKTETKTQRQREGQSSIASAFSQPAKTQRKHCQTKNGLPNNLRETMLQHGKNTTAATRLLDALYREKTYDPQTPVTKQTITTLAQKYGIGQRSVTNALQAEKNTTLLIQRTKKCFFGNEPKRVKTSVGGRPPTYYLLPAIDALCALFGVKAQYSDPLQAEDFASPKAYRQALYREFVRRRPGQYGRDWLANRLGVSAKTCRRYDRALGITAQSMYCAWTVTWANIRFLADDAELVPAHAFLETADGKRYPAKRQIACKLLKARHKVVCKYRRPNFYYFASADIVPPPSVTFNETLPTGRFTNCAVAAQSHSPQTPTSMPRETNTHISQQKLKPALQTAPHPVQAALWTPHEMALNDAANDGLSMWLCGDCLKTHVAKTCPDGCQTCGAKAWQRIPDTVWRVPEAHQHWWRKVWKQRQQKQKAPLRH